MSSRGSVVLSESRTLARTDCGDATGEPVFYMHGTPSCHLEPAAFGVTQTAAAVGLRLIVIDWPRDVASTLITGRNIAGRALAKVGATIVVLRCRNSSARPITA